MRQGRVRWLEVRNSRFDGEFRAIFCLIAR
jgi:hypothetical protein